MWCIREVLLCSTTQSSVVNPFPVRQGLKAPRPPPRLHWRGSARWFPQRRHPWRSGALGPGSSGLPFSVGSLGANISTVKAAGLKWEIWSQVKNHCKGSGGAGRCCRRSLQGQSAAEEGTQPRHPARPTAGVPTRRCRGFHCGTVAGRSHRDGATLRHCHRDSSGAPLCQRAGLSKDTSGITITRCRQELPCTGGWHRVTSPSHPCPVLPAVAETGTQETHRDGSRESKTGQKNLLKAAGKNSIIYNRKQRHSWRERSRRGFSSRHNSRLVARCLCTSREQQMERSWCS